MKTVIFPEVLARAAKLSSSRLTGYGGTIREVISDICQTHPALRAHLFYDNCQFKEHFLLTSKGALAGPDTPLSGDDEVEIMLATSGGADAAGLSNEEVQRYALLDVRDSNELEVCRLPGILHIPLSDLDDRIAELDASRRYIVVCYAGVRAERAAVRLMDAGFDKIQVLDGGMKRWAKDVEHGMPMY